MKRSAVNVLWFFASLWSFLSSLAHATTHTSISGYTGNVRVHITTTSGAIFFDSADISGLGLSAPTGYSLADLTDGTQNELVFVGTQANVNTALSKLQHSSGTGTISITHSPNVAFYPANQHFYELITGSFTVTQAHALRHVPVWCVRISGHRNDTRQWTLLMICSMGQMPDQRHGYRRVFRR